MQFASYSDRVKGGFGTPQLLTIPILTKLPLLYHLVDHQRLQLEIAALNTSKFDSLAFDGTLSSVSIIAEKYFIQFMPKNLSITVNSYGFLTGAVEPATATAVVSCNLRYHELC